MNGKEPTNQYRLVHKHTHMFITFMYLGLAKLGALMAGKGTLDRKKVSYTFSSFPANDSGANMFFRSKATL